MLPTEQGLTSGDPRVLLDSVQRDGLILLTAAAGHKAVGLAANLACSVEKVSNFWAGRLVTLTIDDDARHAAEALGMKYLIVATLLGKRNESNIRKRPLIFAAKVNAVNKVVELGYSVWFHDVDMVWLRDPWPEVLRARRRPDGLQFMCDNNCQKNDGPCELNVGLYLAWQSDFTRRVVRAWADSLGSWGDDQDWFVPIVKKRGWECTGSPAQPCVGRLSIPHFRSGSCMARSSYQAELLQQGLIFHPNFIIGEKKLRALASLGFLACTCPAVQKFMSLYPESMHKECERCHEDADGAQQCNTTYPPIVACCKSKL